MRDVIKRDLTAILHPVQEDLARVSGLLEGATLAEGVVETRSLVRDLCDQMEGLQEGVAESVAEAVQAREDRSRLVESVANQLAMASTQLQGLAQDLAERLAELGTTIDAQALVVAPKIVQEVSEAFQLPMDETRKGLLRRKSDVGAGLATAALREELEAIRKDLAPVGPDLDHVVPTLDALAERQSELEKKIDSLAKAVAGLAAKREKAPTVTLNAKERAALVSAIAKAVTSEPAAEPKSGTRELKRATADAAVDPDAPAVRRASAGNGNRVAAAGAMAPRRRRTTKATRLTSNGPAILSSVRSGNGSNRDDSHSEEDTAETEPATAGSVDSQ